MKLSRLINRLLAIFATRVPRVADRFVQSATCALDIEDIACETVPWSPPEKRLRDIRVALVTTAGIHHTWQEPFDMEDSDGDPSFREIDTHDDGLMITHDYYDHADAERDINIVFPLTRLKEFSSEGVVGEVAPMHYSFMGHITGKHVKTLVERTAPEVARRLKAQGVDVVLLTPG